ncbi:hypothetical protein M501DRAFT_1052296 [Patellaria atrata CBS 101060]|uniref:Killer toxin Kp4 domain-containing protein n=1 Tax=Patellaria atrata CBS 101060 TaxID=1346257 RepID=A0A9P4SA83_9PEZI|nr:hypothetical protein M501DRAFT_1052296 [Patellaria atrata CBS 101060]
MHFLALLSLLPLALALPGDTGKNQVTRSASVTLCSKPNRGGTCMQQTHSFSKSNGKRYKLHPEYDNKVNSVYLDKAVGGMLCQLFNAPDCTGDSRFIEHGNMSNMTAFGYDNKISSLKCLICPVS